ncbi:lysozyme-like [Artemia franciscana]
MKTLFAIIFGLFIITASNAKVYERCELALELYNEHSYGRQYLGDWVCMAYYESGLATFVKNPNSYGGNDYGIFQISDHEWCRSPENPDVAECTYDCTSLLDEDINNDAACAVSVQARYGFFAWSGWVNNCQGTNTENWVADCGI